MVGCEAAANWHQWGLFTPSLLVAEKCWVVKPSLLRRAGLPNPCCFFHPQGKYILTPSPISYGEEQLLHFFGQLLGIAIRADVPLPLDLLPSFWKILVGEPLEPDVDLQEADVLTYNYVKKFENVSLLWGRILFPSFDGGL